MNPESSQIKTPADYNRIAQLTNKGLSGDFKNNLIFKIHFETFISLKFKKGKDSDASELFDVIVKGLIKTPTYSEKYLNERELKHAAEYGVKKKDLINPKTEPAIKRLDQIAMRCRKIGVEINQENYLVFAKELEQLRQETEAIIGVKQ